MSTSTIFALATPYAKSGVAVLRLSGPQALPALVTLTGKTHWPANRLARCLIAHPSSGMPIDQAMAVYFQSPASFTGEDVVELHVHGSLAVLRELLELLSILPGLRMAERGEFTRRAVLNGKMDILEAEGLADLIDAETSEQKGQALRQLQGDMSQFYEQLRRQVIVTLAHLEAYIDFPDEEIPESVREGLEAEVRGVQQTINTTLSRHAAGERIREGISVVIAGAPNAGKSSLLNSVSKRDAAIVSHHAGTTRDLIEVHMELAGFPVILVDTAGLRESDNEIEAEGIRRALKRAHDADITLLLFDGTSEPDAASLGLLGEGVITIATKSDLPALAHSFPATIRISTHTGEGIDALIELIEQRIRAQYAGEGTVITRARHRALLAEAGSHLERFHLITELELQCEELRLAAAAIGTITGKIAVDDILDVIFREFCIGK